MTQDTVLALARRLLQEHEYYDQIRQVTTPLFSPRAERDSDLYRLAEGYDALMRKYDAIEKTVGRSQAYYANFLKDVQSALPKDLVTRMAEDHRQSGNFSETGPLISAITEIRYSLMWAERRITELESSETSSSLPWAKAWFACSQEDYRPLHFPPPGPFWHTGTTGSAHEPTVLAYIPNVPVREQLLLHYWPDAHQIAWGAEDSIRFTDRFPQPSWWK